jgi:hypothetical protein
MLDDLHGPLMLVEERDGSDEGEELRVIATRAGAGSVESEGARERVHDEEGVERRAEAREARRDGVIGSRE